MAVVMSDDRQSKIEAKTGTLQLTVPVCLVLFESRNQAWMLGAALSGYFC